MSEAKSPIVGRESKLMENVAKLVHKKVKTEYDHTDLVATRRGYRFDVAVTVDGKPTGHVARITIELEHFTPPE